MLPHLYGLAPIGERARATSLSVVFDGVGFSGRVAAAAEDLPRDAVGGT